MEDCPSIRTCPFFNDQLASRPATANLMKKSYCNADYRTCARFMVSKALGSSRVPKDLFPNMGDRAKQLVGAG